MTRRAAATLLCGTLALAPVGATQALSRADGDGLERKFQAIVDRGNAPPGALGQPVKTTFTDKELNAYLMYNAVSRLPVGLREPRVTVPAANRFDAVTVVDLDEVRKSKDYGMLGLLLQGVHELKISGTFSGSNGKGVVHIDKAFLDSMAVPQTLIELLVTHFSKTPDMPGGFQLDKPFDLPQRIRTLQLQTGLITVVQ